MIVRAMASGDHRTPHGFMRLLEAAISMNGNGRYRKIRWLEIIGSQPESSETVRQTGRCIRKIQSELHGDMQSQAEMPWPSSADIAVGSNKTVGPYLPWALES